MAYKNENITKIGTSAFCLSEELNSSQIICRLCGSICGKFIDIYGKKGVEDKIPQKINLLLPIQISETDQISLQCCIGCVSTILAWENLVMRCFEVDQYLKSRLEEISHQTVMDEISHQTVVEEISHQTVVEEISHQTVVEEISHQTVLEEMKASPKSVDVSLNQDEGHYLDSYPNDQYFDDNSLDIEQIVLNIEFDEDDQQDEPEGKVNVEDEIDKSIIYLKKTIGVKLENSVDEEPKDVLKIELKDAFDDENLFARETRKKRKREIVSADDDLYLCEICPTTTVSMANMRRHISTKHTKNNTAQCEYCGFTTSTKYLLKHHVDRMHHKENLSKCPFCEFRTVNSCKLKMHMNVKHFKSTIYKCDDCPFESLNKFVLNRHVGVVHKNMVHKCRYCAYSCPSLSDLNIHINGRHTKEVSYSCDHCPFETYYQKKLRAHIKLKHKEYY